MKIRFTLLFVLGLYLMGSSQKTFINYETDSKWFIGLNAGATYHTSDIETRLKAGFGIFVGRSFFMKKGSPFYLDARLRYLRLQFEGVDKFKSVDVTPNPYLNGTYNTVNYGNNGAIMNFSGDHHRVAIELALGFNKLRERTGVNLYLLGGAGFNSINNKGDYQYSPGDSLVNYSGDYDTYKNQFDGDNETALPTPNATIGPINKDDRTWAFMPSAGIGIGYQIGPKFSIGIEHETTFTLSDLFDGNQWVGNQGNNDMYHFTSLWLKFHIGSKKHTDDIGDNSLDNIDNYDTTTNVVSTQKEPPVVNFTNPHSSPYETDAETFIIKADIQNVYNGSNVTFKQNGTVNSNFTFNPSTNYFESHVNLTPGNNVFEIKGTNSVGHDYASTIIIRKQEEAAPPIVTYSNPVTSPHVTSSPVFNVTGNVLNVQNKNQVTFTFNGNTTTDFNFNTGDGAFSKSLSLSEGANIVTVKGTNEAGSDEKSVTIIYEKIQEVHPPEVNFVNPSQNPYTVEEENFNIIASVINVDGKNNITYKVNGQSTTNFSYNTNTKLLESSIQLVEGANVIEVTGTNQAGSDYASTTIIYKKPRSIEPPNVYFTQPNVNPKTLFVNNTIVKAKVINVESKSNIELKINGNVTSNFTFYTSSKEVVFNTSLEVGANIFEITGTNEAGQASASTTIIYKTFDTYNPPEVTITNPAPNPFTTFNDHYNVIAQVLNVSGKQNITVKRNGTIVNNFLYNAATKTVQFNMQLNEGNNVVEITGTNNYGQDSDSKTIIYKKPDVPKPPTVNITTPNTSPYTTYVSNSTVVAKLTNIQSKQQVSVRVNNVLVPLSQYSWNPSTEEITLNKNMVLGNNIIKVTATNNDGTAYDITTIIFKKKETPCQNPVITIQTPAQNGSTTSNLALNFVAALQNIANASQLKLKFNGVFISSFNYNNGTKKMTKTLSLNQGTNVIEVIATNDCGTASKSVIINYVPEQEPCNSPTVQGITPGSSSVSTEQQVMIFKASVQNASQQQITFKHNNQVKNFSYDPSSHILQAQVNLVEGNNSIQVLAQTDCGVAFYTWNVTRTVCNAPSVTITQPANNSQTQSPSIQINATIENASQNQIQLSVNGQLRNFVFNPTSNLLTSTQSLNEGSNSISIKAINECGQDVKTINVNYKKPYVANPPIVTIIYPSNNPHSTNQQTSQIKATIQNVYSSNDVQFKLNGANQSFNFNASNGMFITTVNLQPGNNTFTVTGVNQDGQDSKSQVIIYNPPVTINPPKVVFQNPSSSPHQVPAKYYTVKGYVNNVSNPSQVQVLINNNNMSNYASNVSGNKVYFQFQLAFSTTNAVYNVTVIGTNSAGVDQESVRLNYQLGSNPMGSGGGNTYSGGNNDGNSGNNGNGNNNGNNGHGNNDDGVDVSNPGQGGGGPNGQNDPSGSNDDESGNNSGSGNSNNGGNSGNAGNNGNGGGSNLRINNGGGRNTNIQRNNTINNNNSKKENNTNTKSGTGGSSTLKTGGGNTRTIQRGGGGR